MKVEGRFEGASNFIPWKSRVLLLLEENDLLQCVNVKVPESEAEEDHHHKKQKNAYHTKSFLLWHHFSSSEVCLL